jgi:aspartate-semialdehyde dehydrogenase
VRVPVFIGHAEAVHVEFEQPVTVAEARAVLRAAPGVQVMDEREDGGYMTPLESQGEDATYVSRIRKDPTVEHGLAFWCVADNLRKGAALNAVQIAETLVAQGMLDRKAA